MAENGYSLLKASLPGQLPNTVSIYIRNNRKQTIQLRTSSRFTPQEISTAVAKRLNVPPVEQLLFHKGKLLHLSATTKEIQLTHNAILHLVDFRNLTSKLTIKIRRLDTAIPPSTYCIDAKMKVAEFFEQFMDRAERDDFFLVYTGRELSRKKTFRQQFVEDQAEIFCLHKQLDQVGKKNTQSQVVNTQANEEDNLLSSFKLLEERKQKGNQFKHLQIESEKYFGEETSNNAIKTGHAIETVDSDILENIPDEEKCFSDQLLDTSIEISPGPEKRKYMIEPIMEISADRELSEELIETQGYAKRLEDEIAGQFTLGAFSKKNIVGQGCDISSYLPLEGSMNVSQPNQLQTAVADFYKENENISSILERDESQNPEKQRKDETLFSTVSIGQNAAQPLHGNITINNSLSIQDRIEGQFEHRAPEILSNDPYVSTYQQEIVEVSEEDSMASKKLNILASERKGEFQSNQFILHNQGIKPGRLLQEEELLVYSVCHSYAEAIKQAVSQKFEQQIQVQQSMPQSNLFFANMYQSMPMPIDSSVSNISTNTIPFYDIPQQQQELQKIESLLYEEIQVSEDLNCVQDNEHDEVIEENMRGLTEMISASLAQSESQDKENPKKKKRLQLKPGELLFSCELNSLDPLCLFWQYGQVGSG